MAAPRSGRSNPSTPIRYSSTATHPPASRDSFYAPTSDEDEEEVIEHVYYHDRDDLDSAYGDDSLIGDDTKTLSCYITDYRFEYGRRYHSYRDGAYWVYIYLSL